MNWFKTQYRIRPAVVLYEDGAIKTMYLPQYKYWYSFKWVYLFNDPTSFIDCANFIAALKNLPEPTYL